MTLPFKSKNSPAPVIHPLSETEVEAVAKTMYNRFIHEYGITPCWGSSSKLQKTIILFTSMVINSLRLLGFTITRQGNTNE